MYDSEAMLITSLTYIILLFFSKTLIACFILMAVMVITRLAIIHNVSFKVSSDQFLYITTAATNNLYSLSLKHILSTLAHITGQHDRYAHLSKYGSNAALTSTALR